jgi:nucleoside-diphosphate kinase
LGFSYFAIGYADRLASHLEITITKLEYPPSRFLERQQGWDLCSENGLRQQSVDAKLQERFTTSKDNNERMKTLQRTLSIIKPDAVERGAAGDIINTLLGNKFRIVGMKMLHINKAQAEGFYAVHVHRPFFESLTDFMSNGPVVVMALEKEDAIADYRKLMGATDPAKADEGTIRKKWASSIEANAVHGSDAEDTARFELSYFFAGYELAK